MTRKQPDPEGDAVEHRRPRNRSLPVDLYRLLFLETSRQRHVGAPNDHWAIVAGRVSTKVLCVLLLASLLPVGIGRADEPTTSRETPALASDGQQWKTLEGSWVACEFGDDGPVQVTKDQIRLSPGDPLTGVRWTGPVFRDNFEVELEARRVDGLDFFCALTFPVGRDHVSFVLGGWGGGVIGISSVDGYDASENNTSGYREFVQNRWYKVRVRVTPKAIECWIDDHRVVQQLREDHRFDVRFEMDVSLPLGIAAYECDSEIRNIRMRSLEPKEDSEPAEDREDDSNRRETDDGKQTDS